MKIAESAVFTAKIAIEICDKNGPKVPKNLYLSRVSQKNTDYEFRIIIGIL